MIAGLKPYPAMKYSGVEWLGAVPAHWEIVPAFVAYRPREIRNVGVVEKTVLSLSYGRIVVKPEEKLRGLVPESFETYQIVDPGNIIVRTTDLQNDRNSLRIGHARNRGIITSAYMCLETTDEVENEFGYQYLNAYDLLKIIYGYGSGLRQNLDFKDIKRMPVLLPPKDEQVAIVRFLDHADRRIRRAIAAKQKLIRLLEEQKQAIIHRAVTRGLDPDVRLKPSGVEWLGDVPEHWDVSQVRSIARVVRGGSPRPAGSPLYFHGTGASWITVGEVTRAFGMYVTETSTRLTPAGAERSRMIEPGTFLLTNSGATLGVPKISLIQGCINDGVAALVNLRPQIRKEFLLHYFTTQTAHLRAWVNLGAQPNLNTQIIGGWPALIPSVAEQDAIVQYIESSTKVLLQTVDRVCDEISLLREYRTRLIADVVTGKLDVREAAARLPESSEPELADDEALDAEGYDASLDEAIAEDEAA